MVLIVVRAALSANFGRWEMMVGNVPPFVLLCVDYNIFGDVE